MYTDKTLTCRECNAEFSFTASEQEFYADKGFQNEPVRCPDCRAKRRTTNRRERKMFSVICDECGATTQVPFQPSGDRPVYCHDCYAKHNSR